MEDAQPNEVRLSRKGSTAVPRVRAVYSPYRRPTRPRRPLPESRHDAGYPNRHSAHPDSAERVEVLLPPECHKGQPGNFKARRRWTEDQRHRLQTDRPHSIVSFEYSGDGRKVLFTCRARPRHHTKVATGSRPHALNTESAGITRQCTTALSTCGASGTSRTKPGPSHRERSENTDSFPRHQSIVHASPSINNITDSFLGTLNVTEEVHSARWSTFRSGYLDIRLPSLSISSRISPEETGMDPPAQLREQCQEVPVDHRIDNNLRPFLPNTPTGNVVTNDYQTSEFSGHQLSQRDVPPADYFNHHRGHSVERGTVALSLNHSPPLPDFTFTCVGDTIPLSLGPRDKPRRLLHNHDFIYIVTAHGTIDQLGTADVLKWDGTVRSPSSPLEETVEDACILSHLGEPVVVLGHRRERNQVSLLNLRRGQVSRYTALDCDRNAAKKSGVSAVASLMSPLKFASGSFDHRVHMWDIAQDLSGASAVELAIKHSSAVYSLLPILDSSHKLVSAGADRDVHFYDMSAERVVQTLRLSSIPYHAHNIDFKSCTLLEVAHLEMQFEVRDYRIPDRAVERFGYVTEPWRGRFNKAGTWSHFVACGDGDGAVHVWDLRNVTKEVAVQQCFSNPVIQVVNVGSRLVACSRRNELSYMDF